MKRNNGRKHLPAGFTRHHRKPRSLGGDSSPRNISVVLKRKHEAWTELFDNFSATKIAVLFGEYFREFSDNSVALRRARQAALLSLQESRLLNKFASIYSEEELKEVERTLEDRAAKTRKYRAWIILFGKQRLEEAIKEVNSVWLDPDYKFVIDIHIEKIAIRRSS